MYLKPELAALLQNNDAPSESTILEIKELLKGPLNELKEVEAEIQRLGELMEAVKTKRQTIQKIISDHTIILSPVRRLPPDVLHEIFFNCLPTHHNPIMKNSESPLLLTQICSSWRAIALSSPRIWSKVYIPLPGDPRFFSGYGVITDETSLSIRRQRFAGVMRLRCDAARTWLSRSGTCPLSIAVTYPDRCYGIQDPDWEPDDELIREMFDILVSFADRWRDVDLSMPEEIYMKLQGDIHPATFSSLNSLQITLYHTVAHWNSTTPTPIRLLAAPSLRRINISAIETLHLTGNLTVRPIWNRIAHITFSSSITDRNLLVLLRQCPSLVSGKFLVCPASALDQADMADLEGAVLLPHLESFAVNDSGIHETMALIFTTIKAPALTRFSYQSFNQRSPPWEDSTIPLSNTVIPLLENSTLINYLALDGELSSQHTQECLQYVPQVTRVVFGRPLFANPSGQLFPPYPVPDGLVRPDHFDLKILSIGSGAVPLLPKLGSLEAYHISSFTDEDLLDMITSRINAFKRGEIAPLKFVKIDFQRRRQKDISEDLSRLAKEAGIDVRLDLSYPPEGPRSLDPLSPSFGFASHKRDNYLWPSEMI